MKKIFLYVFFIHVSAIAVIAQLPGDNLVLYSLTEQNGLSDNQVNCFFQDSKGFIWIGTLDGLNLYDGSVIKIFKKRPGDNSQLIDNTINAITEDADHHIWIATGQGLSEYDPEKNIFYSYRPDINAADINTMTDLAFDNQGNLWITSFGGLLEFIPSQKKFFRFINANIKNERAANRLNKIIIDDQKRVWVAGYSGLWQFFPKDAHFEQDDSTGLVTKMTMDHAGKIWLGHWQSGLKLFDPEKKILETVTDPALPKTITGVAELKDPDGEYSIWCNSLAEYKPLQKKTIKHSPANADLPTDYSSAKLYMSSEGLLWIGTNKGVRIMDPKKQFFHHHFISSSEITPQGISFLQNKDRFYIGGVDENFLTLYDHDFKLIKKVIPQPYFIEGNTRIAPALLNITREDKDHLWLCTERGLILLNEKTGQQQIFRLTEKDISTSTKNFFSSIFIDSKGNHWVFPWRSGIWQLDIKTGQFKKMIISISKENAQERKLIVSNAAEDPQGNIWFADLDEGVLFFDHITGGFSKPLEKLFGGLYSIPSIIAEGDYIWCVKTERVFRIETQTKKVEQWAIPDEFNKNVTGFCSDRSGHLWITTNSGLLSFDKKEHTFKRYTSNDGLLDNVMAGSIYPLDNGKVIYASNNYVTEFDPAEMMKSYKPPPVQITNIFSQNKPVSIEYDRQQKKYIDLNYTYNNFTFSWSVLNYSNPLQNRFYCKLESVDKDWKFVGYTGQAQYASLAPGKYIFRVRGATSEGIMNEQGDSVEIIIHPPFWKTWWFISIVSIVLLTGFVVVVRYISQRNLKEQLLRLEKEQAVEKERNRISRDMHDDLGSGLTKIAIMSEVVKKQIHEPEKAKQQLENISESSRELVDSLQDIIWVLNPKNDTLESLAAYIREYALKFFEPIEASVEFSFPEKFPEIKLSEETRRNIFLVAKESFNNIAKHAWCNTIKIEIRYSSGIISLFIRDDGKGFVPEKVRLFGNGLINMKNRIEQVGGRFDISSEPGKGTKTSIQIPI